MRGMTVTPPFRPKAPSFTPTVARSGWNTFIQRNKWPPSLLPLSMWVNKFDFPCLRPYNSQNNLSEMLGTESLANDNSQTTAGLFLNHCLAFWLGLDTPCNVSACDEIFLVGLEESFKKGKTMVNMEEESFCTFALEGDVVSTMFN